MAYVSFTPHEIKGKPQNRWIIQKSTQMLIRVLFDRQNKMMNGGIYYN